MAGRARLFLTKRIAKVAIAPALIPWALRREK